MVVTTEATQPLALIVYRNGVTTLPYHPARLRASIAAACHSIRLGEGVSEDVSRRVETDVARWLSSKSEVTSSDLRRIAAKSLVRHCPEAGYYYEHEKALL